MADESAIEFPLIWKQLSLRFPANCPTIHGPDHWRRVENNGLELAAATPGCDLVVVRLFAVFHDSQRMNDWGDPDHGPRAAKFARKKRHNWFEISDAQMALLYEACHDHTNGGTHDDPTIGCCWDADRLDLPRVHIVPHPDFMSTAEGKRRAAKFEE